MFAEERKLRIFDFLMDHRKETVAELVSYFNVSNTTIRNDLREMESDNLLKDGDTIIRDTGDPGEKQLLEEKGLDVIVAPPHTDVHEALSSPGSSTIDGPRRPGRSVAS